MQATRLILVLWCTIAASVANAGNHIVVLIDPERGDLSLALQVALANRHVDVSSLPAPNGALRLERAALVQRAASLNAADAGVWIDEDASGTEVCVVSADGRSLRHAPLPSDLQPRVFSAIAVSLLDELLAPPEAPAMVGVDVHVQIEPNAPGLVAQPPVLASSPAQLVAVPPLPEALVALPTVVAEHPGDPVRWTRTLVEIGVTASPASIGVEAELAFPVRPSWRVGVLGGVDRLFDGIDDTLIQVTAGGRMYDVGAELRHVGAGATHFDVGFVGGVVRADDPMQMVTGAIESFTTGFAAVRLGVTREYSGSAMSLSISPTVLVGGSSGITLIPGLVASLRWELPI